MVMEMKGVRRGLEIVITTPKPPKRGSQNTLGVHGSLHYFTSNNTVPISSL